MARITISTLGSLAVHRDGRPVDAFEYHKVRALLVFLAVEAGRPHTRASLAALLWPDLPERTARGNLSQALSTLRRALGEADADPPLVLAGPETVQLHPDRDVVVDHAAFLEHVRAADAHAHRSWRTCALCAARLDTALALYGGDFLAGHAVADSSPFEEWSTLQREHARQRAVGALEHRIERAEWCGAFAEAAEHARRIVTLEPFGESGHRSLIRMLVLDGQPAAALAHGQALRRTLAAELGAEPEDETERLCERIRLAGPDGVPRRTAPAFRGPAAPAPLIGRGADLAAIQDRLRDGVRALTLTGAGGIGKTRLALQAARELRHDFEDGVHVVELAALGDPGLVPVAIARALGVRDAGTAPVGRALLDHLRDKHLLLVLDNVEHLLDGPPGDDPAAFVAELLAACPQLKELATSRAPLRIRAEHLHPVAPLPAAEAEALFWARATAVRPDLAPTADNVAAVAAICRRLDGLPLAIELIAARARDHLPDALLRDLDRGLAALTEGARDHPARHRTLERAIAGSYDRLAPEAQQLFAHLGVFAGGGTAAAARAVVGDVGDSVAPSAVPAILARLAELSLIAWHEPAEPAGAAGAAGAAGEPREPRFTLLAPIRDFAVEQLARTGGAEAARRRHAAHFLGLAEAAAEHERSPEHVSWLDRLELEHDNLRAALAVLVGAAPEDALRLAAALGPFWGVRGYLGEGRRWLAAALAAAPAAPAARRAAAFGAAGALAWRQGDHAAARALHSQGLALWQELEDGRAIAAALRRLGGVAWDEGDSETARAYYADSLAIARELGDDAATAGALNNLGLVAAGAGDHAAACVLFDECLPILRALHDEANVGNALLNLGLAKWNLGDATAGRSLLDASLATFRALGHKSGVALVLFNLANLEVALADLEAAEAHYDESLALHRALDDRADASYPLFGLGRIALRRGDTRAARDHMTQSLALRLATGERRPIAGNLEGLAGLDRVTGQPERAARLLGAAAALRDALGIPPKPADVEWVAHETAALRAALGDAAFAAAFAEGRGWSAEAALEAVGGGA